MSCHDHDCDCHEHHHEEEPLDPKFVFGPRVPVEPIPLRAGPITVLFDPEWGFLRRFRLQGKKELLRAIYSATRTNTWATVTPTISDVQVDDQGDHFKVTFAVATHEPSEGLVFDWKGEIIGEANGTISYRLEGECGADFQSNRIGLCTLNPNLECAGQAVTVEHVDGKSTKGEFPRYLEPWQPFTAIRSLTHLAAPGLLAKVTMEGADYEMEDQRNWSDASFKTYPGMLDQGIPLHFTKGQKVSQCVRFELIGAPPPWEAQALKAMTQDEPVMIGLPQSDRAFLPMPSIGTRWAQDVGPLADDVLEALKRLKLGHVMLDVDLTSADWRELLNRSWEEISKLGCKVLLAVKTGNEVAQVERVVNELTSDLVSEAARILGVMVHAASGPVPTNEVLAAVQAGFGSMRPDLVVSAMPGSTYAEINRNRPAPAFGAAIPLCPQVHTFDFVSMMENIQAQASILESCRTWNAHPIHVAPVGLLRRRKPDARQASLFCGAWTAGSLAALCPTGLASTLTYHEHLGVNGLAGTPTADVLQSIAGATSAAAVGVSDPLRLAALALRTPEGPKLLIANLTSQPLLLGFYGDEDPVLELGPCAFGCVEVEEQD